MPFQSFKPSESSQSSKSSTSPSISSSLIESENEMESNATERKQERDLEDRAFTPVIIKRSDEAIRHPDDTLEKAIHEGREQINRPLASLSAGPCKVQLFRQWNGEVRLPNQESDNIDTNDLADSRRRCQDQPAAQWFYTTC